MSDWLIQLACAGDTIWPIIAWRSPENIVKLYLSNDLSLEPGVIAFLYYRRWDEEKYFDTFKNDLAGAQAWGKNLIALEQQCLLGIMTPILTRLFLQKQCTELALTTEAGTQPKRYAKKQEHYLSVKAIADTTTSEGASTATLDEDDEPGDINCYDAYRAFYAIPSKISRHVWRFLKYCYALKSTPELYRRRLKPVMMGYL